MICCTLLYVHSSIAIILMGKRELVALLNLSSRCLVIVEWLFLLVPWGCLLFVIVVFPDHTHFFLGRTDLVAHEVKLTDDTPFKEPYRCIPPGLYEEVRQHLKGVIEA